MGYVGIEEDYYVSVKSVLDITAETGALTTQSRIRELTPANVVPVIHGKWLPTNDDNKKRCNKCDTVVLIAMYPNGNANFCPNCGARMDARGEE